MKKGMKKLIAALMMITMFMVMALPVYAASEDAAAETVVSEEAEVVTVEQSEASLKSTKAWAAALVVGAAAAIGAFGMAWAITKAIDGIARQPEAEGKIRTTMMLGLIFVETAIIYALIVGILIIFVL